MVELPASHLVLCVFREVASVDLAITSSYRSGSAFGVGVACIDTPSSTSICCGWVHQSLAAIISRGTLGRVPTDKKCYIRSSLQTLQNTREIANERG